MKKRILLVSVLSIILIVVIVIMINSKQKYTVEVTIVDDQSPDRILTVYNKEHQKIEVRKIELMDGTLLCNGYNTTVHFGDIENETEVKIILEDKTEVIAKIVKEEVKE